MATDCQPAAPTVSDLAVCYVVLTMLCRLSMPSGWAQPFTGESENHCVRPRHTTVHREVRPVPPLLPFERRSVPPQQGLHLCICTRLADIGTSAPP